MGLGSVKKQKPQALKAEQVKHVLNKNNRTIVKIMQLLDYQHKRKERSDAVSRKIEKLKMRLNRRLVKLAKAMDAPPERNAADAFDRGLGTAALARAATKQQSRRSSASASAAMPVRGGMPPYDMYHGQYDIGLGSYNPATAPFYRPPPGLTGLSSAIPTPGMGQSSWYGYGASAYHDPQAGQAGQQQHPSQGIDMFSQQQLQSLLHSLGGANLSTLLQLQKQNVQNASMQMNMQDARGQMQGMSQASPHMYQQFPGGNFQQSSYPQAGMSQPQQHHQYGHQQQMPHPQAQGVMGSQQYPPQSNLGHMPPGQGGPRHP